jgi:hypothetical protein
MHKLYRSASMKDEGIIAEIPDPSCVDDPGLKAVLFEVRRVLRTIPRHGLAGVDGVGFFDVIHSQGTRAKRFRAASGAPGPVPTAIAGEGWWSQRSALTSRTPL